MIFDRRTFLRNGVALGFGSWVWSNLGQKMGQSLAATNGQKLALLLAMGRGGRGRENLPGCASDSALLGEVLQGRYSFSADNLVSLGADKGTLPQLEMAFDQHLRQRVQKGDRVVLAFSGYGSYNPSPDLSPNPTWEQALPYLGLVLSGEGDEQVLPLTTLVTWLQSLKTKQVYLILDCGFGNQYVKFQGNLRSRSAGVVMAKAEGETANSSASSKVALGNLTLISAAAPGQTAVEGQLGKVTAGLFTVALCQSLWENTAPNLMPSLWDHSRNLLVPRLGNQQIPQWKSPNNSPDFLAPNGLMAGGEGVVTALQDKNSLQGHLWGVNPLVQKRALLHSCYLTVNNLNGLNGADDSNNSDSKTSNTKNPASLWQVHNLKGQQATLTAIAIGKTEKSEPKSPRGDENFAPSSVGSSLREMYRALPKSLALTVALADDLDRIERVDATSAFGAIATVESVVNAGEGSADCVFGPLENHRYSLFTEGGDPLQPLTKSESSGAVKTVVSALEPCLSRLLALKWLTLLANGDSTRLGVAMDLVQQTSGDNPLPRLIYQWRSTRSSHSPQDTGNQVNTVPNAPPTFLPSVATNQALQCQLENFGEEPLYGCLIGVNNRGLSVAGMLHPELKLLQAKERLAWPPPEDSLWLIGGDKAIAHWFLILSRFALPGTAAALGQQFTGNNPSNSLNLDSNLSRVIALKNLLPVVLALVEDLSSHRAAVAPVPDDMVLLATSDWLSLPIMYQVV